MCLSSDPSTQPGKTDSIMLDDIVCLGVNLPDDKINNHRVSGVVLHIGESAPYSLVFKREKTSVVHIGRRSGQDTDKGQNDPTCAMFRCAVVSRKHAKIVFSDSGPAYIIDSGSHHGTHLRKQGDSSTRMLKPETSTLLNDGDVLTFGKAVGKRDEWVKPIVARVHLLHASPSLSIPSPSSSEKSRSTSGRFGLYSSASEDSYSNSSDVEEGSLPDLTDPIPPTSQEPRASGTSAESFKPDAPEDCAQVKAAYSAFKRLISPAIRRLPSVSEIIGEKGAGLFDVAGKSLQLHTLPTIAIASLSSQLRRQDDDAVKTRDIDQLRLASRASSPMDLESPPIDSENRELVLSPLSSPLLTPPIEPLVVSPLILPDGPSARSSLEPGIPEFDLDFDICDMSEVFHEHTVDWQIPSPCPSPSSPKPNVTSETPATSSEISEIRRTLKQFEVSINKLHASRRNFKSGFNANVSYMANKLSEIDDKFAEVDAEYNVLCDQVEDIQHGDLPEVWRQIDDLNERVSSHDDFETPEPQTLQAEHINSTVKSLNDLIDEMRTEFTRMKTTREEAAKTIEEVFALVASAKAQTTDQTPLPTSLKRKRDDVDEDGDVVGGSAQVVVVDSRGAEKPAAVDDQMEVDFKNDIAAAEIVWNHTEPPPRKKIRAIGSVVAQTATAVTIGAVITWSALAFS